jgi:hypothetical protein
VIAASGITLLGAMAMLAGRLWAGTRHEQPLAAHGERDFVPAI